MARVMSDATPTPPPDAGPLSHIDDNGAAHMVDVTEKATTNAPRSPRAHCEHPRTWWN